MVNVDASFDENVGCGSVGMIAQGKLLHSQLCVSFGGCAHGGCICVEGSYVLAQHIECNRLIIQSGLHGGGRNNEW